MPGRHYGNPSWRPCNRAECLDCGVDLPKKAFKPKGPKDTSLRTCPKCGSSRLLPYYTNDEVKRR